ncbi:MAG: GDSL-type esterase/lipase family protein [Fuerstiella sp.]
MLRVFFLVSTAAFVCTLFVLRMPGAVADDQLKFVLPETDDGLPGAGPIRRYDWFRQLWKTRRADFAKKAPAESGAVVFLGDSITQGWGSRLQSSFPGMKVANRGISGDTTRGMLIRLNEDVLSLKPSAVVLLMGTNDLEEKATPDTIASNVALIVSALKAHDPEMPIVLCNVFPSSATKSRSATDIKQVNSLYAAAVKGDAQVTVLDTWTLFANSDGDAKLEEFPDLLHPNAEGYAKWAAALRPVFATLGFVDTAVDEFVVEDGFRSLFNGKDLTGWGYQATTPQMLKSRERWQKNDKNAPAWPIVEEAVSFDGMTRTPDGRYVAVNGRLVVTTPPEGRKIQQLWTTESFGKDFVLKLEFRATPNADSGVFLRQPQLQCRDFVLAGPYKDLKNYRAQDWNELVVEVKGTVARCTCNGEVLEAEFKVPQNGPIGLEGDRGQIEYRRIRISEGK